MNVCEAHIPPDACPATEAATISPSADDAEFRDLARNLEENSPNWIVLWGKYTHQFVAFPRFDAPRGTIVTAIYPDALVGRLREVERTLNISTKTGGTPR